MSSIRIRIIDRSNDWDALEPRWQRLARANPKTSTALQFAWMRTWWKVYQGDTDGAGCLRLFTFWRDRELVGVLPLYLAATRTSFPSLRQLRFLSSGEPAGHATCADYLNLLALPGEEGACLAALRQHLPNENWDALELSEIPADSPLLNSRWNPGRSQISPRGCCPFANLTGGLEVYLARLSANSRQSARRQFRAAARAGAVLEIATPAEAPAFFDDLVRLHQQRWNAAGKPGCFASPLFTQFHRALIAQWIPSGQAVLARLSVAGKCQAVLYGFVTGRKFDFYQSGVNRDENGPLNSPGITAHLLLMQWLSERNVQEYDFLRGAEHYKDRLATDEHRLFTLRTWKNTLPAVAHRSTQAVGIAARRVLQTWRGRPPVKS